MGTEQELRRVRLAKLQALCDAGINPYPYRFPRTHTLGQVRECWGHLEGEAMSEGTVSAAGRITNWRDMGKTVFADLRDQSGHIQVYLNQKTLGAEAFGLMRHADLGDFLGVTGRVFRTRTGELSVRAEKAELLCKALRPLPDKHSGLKNPELVHRDRSSYFTSDPEAREVFVKRARAIAAVREFLSARGFLEVETPLLQPLYGGAAARPFKTHVHAIDETYYLQISPELYLKRLIAGGFDRVFTVCKNFRNEGIDKTHNPEFTMMECYQAYADYTDILELTENLYAHVFRTVLGATTVGVPSDEAGGTLVELRFEPPWPRYRMLDLVQQHSALAVGDLDASGLRSALLALPSDHALFTEMPRERIGALSWGEMVQALFEFHVQSQLVHPCFVLDHPKETSPLCKPHRSDPRLIERFEPFANGWEIGNAYSELNDPVLQRELLEEQAARRSGGDEEAQPMDEDFCAAVELGMPPMGGLGLGVDRLVMLLSGQSNIKDVILFPFTRSGKGEGRAE
ncbi:MAG: lysine--tRNA ligase [Planctomycetes bacterium]|nr:lysine--tRNA ligase [Planctomycetota bacterium]